ncbi:helix-turn-helix transcriptional regulator [Phytohabitans sp. ZYX-F-186]|uniref:Helix-turn-helix transcriptional regulator n=1 Tax=Phytohabitans maris TaxID=3071409 RepID=A0ABU0ZV11_9ACTN|nr:helix-turn-helix transcriptional regulator [Phytohabitans sp. ZYX-F-186]MDQ7910795.1 helix-turn-helix transcriptional regulator [Phytohabitans sp. ZYX-F-186]
MARSISDPRFPPTLRRLRDERGLSLRELGRRVHHSKTYLHELETGVKTPTVETAQALDVVLDAGGELARMVSVDTGGVRRRTFVAAAGIAAALPHQRLAFGRRVGADLPAQLVTRAARLRRLDDYLGGADTYRLYAAEVESTKTLIRDGSYTEATGLGLLAVLAEQAQLAGWAAFDAGLHGDADRLYRTSLAAAQDAADPALAGNAWAFIAYLRLGLGQPGVDEAVAAVETAGPGVTPGVRALLHCRRAWAHAVMGQAADAERHLALGATALTEHDDRPEPDWVYWVDRSEVEIMTGRCWTVLRRPLRAITVLEQVLAAYDDTHARDKALYLSWLADAYLDAHEVEQACETAGRAVELSAGVGSIRPGQRIDGFLGRLDPYGSLPCVVDLRARAVEWARTGRRLTSAATPDTPPPPPRSA